jgi:hypothetical protein
LGAKKIRFKTKVETNIYYVEVSKMIKRMFFTIILLFVICATYSSAQMQGRERWLGNELTPRNVPLLVDEIISSLERIDMNKIIGLEGFGYIRTVKHEWDAEIEGKRRKANHYKLIWRDGSDCEIGIRIVFFSSVEDAENMWLVNSVFVFNPEQRMREYPIGNASWVSSEPEYKGSHVLFLRKNVECVVYFDYPETWQKDDLSKEYALKIAREIDKLLNLSPTITKVKLQDKKIKPKGSFAINVTANDPDQDSLSYTYTLDNKSFSSTSNKQTFTAPYSRGKYNLHIKVEDGHGGVAEKNIEIEVK